MDLLTEFFENVSNEQTYAGKIQFYDSKMDSVKAEITLYDQTIVTKQKTILKLQGDILAHEANRNSLNDAMDILATNKNSIIAAQKANIYIYIYILFFALYNFSYRSLDDRAGAA